MIIILIYTVEVFEAVSDSRPLARSASARVTSIPIPELDLE